MKSVQQGLDKKHLSKIETVEQFKCDFCSKAVKGDEAEIFERAQRVLLDKIAVLELTREWCEKGIKDETIEEYVRKRMPCTSQMVRCETYGKDGVKHE